MFEHFESSRMAAFDERIVPWEWDAGLARSAYIRRHRDDFRALESRWLRGRDPGRLDSPR